MKTAFIETENSARFQTALKEMARRGASEACLMVVDGEPGLGKTTGLDRWATQTGALYLRAKKEWTPSWFMRDLLAEFRIPAPHSFQKGFGLAMEALMQRQSSAAMASRQFGVVIDEADHISRSAEIIESIRDFSDIGDIPFILVGMGRIRTNLTRFPQVASRISQYVKFEKASLADVRRMVDGLCEVPVADDLVAFILRATDGYNREILEAIASVERFGKRNGATAENPVKLAAMARQVLIHDRRTGQAIHVPEAV
ncbi:AAA family ATPase [Camelimonas lactis]|uniref:DNA transposition AAA+ family ATPase n=1 Tax=Camelimonas lactis TaxID=659006 RepID=A0A4R2GZ77_9HYPH|nr:ATP-binding protein [Camelimonas lactis]TCO15212.1 DNA transposition AAA+ family ATPase [Camelimonas lactis]